MPIFCFLRAIWRTFTHPIGFTRVNGETVVCSGHKLQNDEEDISALVTTGHCMDCGKRDISWVRKSE